MPVIKSAKKKLRKDRKRTKQNETQKKLLQEAIKKARKNPTIVNYSKAAGLADKAAKKNILHKNKAAHIKSALSKLLPKKPSSAKPVNKSKSTAKK